MLRYRLTVGDEACDIRGFTSVHVQAAVDRVAMLGGGEVVLSAGAFYMADSVHLRSCTHVRGHGEATILRKNAQKGSRVNAFLGYGHYDICVEDPDAFAPGDGVWIRDDKAGGFYTTVGTLVRREGDVWYTTRPHCHDYLPQSNAVVETVFPIISGYDIEGAVVEDLAIDGNLAENPTMITGCRGGGVFIMRSSGVVLRRLAVRNCNSEGISFQTCDDLQIADCLVEGCTGNGYHPGSGSNRFHIRGCIARGNGRSGLFYCLRVRDSLLEDCTFESNALHGVSIGARDSGSVNRRLTVRNNGGCGFFFRQDSRNNAPDNTTIDGCTFEANGSAAGSADLPEAAEILIQGEVDGTKVLGCTLRPRPGIPAIRIGAGVLTVELADNQVAPGAAPPIDLRRPPAEA